MQAIIWKPKDPAETVLYTIDWAAQLGADTIASYTFTVSSGDATVAKEEVLSQALNVWIAGGTTATTTVFLNTVTTGSGQVLERQFSLYVATGEDSYVPTSTSKRDLIGRMFEQVALNGWEYDIQPEEMDKALFRLDAMMWELRGRGLDIGYNFPTGIGQGNLADDLGCPDQAFYVLSVLGAQRLCPTIGKSLSKESREALNDAMKALRALVPVPSMSLAAGTPVGSGNRAQWPRYPYAI